MSDYCTIDGIIFPTEKLAQTLEIKDQEEAELVPSSLAHSLSPSSETVHRQTVDSLTHHIEVQVLESGQVAMTSTAVTFGPNTEPTPVVAQDTLSVVQDSRVRTPPTVQSNTQSRKASSAGGRRRRSNGSSCSNRGDEVEVDGQFDMPIPESSTAGVVSSTGSNTVMTFVTTSEELNQTTPQEEEHSQPSLSGGHGGGAPVSQQLASSSCTPLHTLAACTKTPPPALTATLTIEPVKQVSVDASTQTMNGRLRSEVQDRTPLIIRRSRAGKVKKLTAPLTTQQQLTTPDATVRLSTGNGNETGTQTHQAVQVQTQSPSEIEATSVETEAPIDEQGQSFTHTPRRSTRKSAHKVSPSEPVTTAKTSSPSRRMSPRKSPVETTTVSPKRIQTRAVAKRAVQLEEVDAPPAKRTRKAVLQRRKDSEEDEVKHPQEWGVDEVAEYISSIQKDCAGVFKEHVSVVLVQCHGQTLPIWTLYGCYIHVITLFVAHISCRRWMVSRYFP